MAISDFSLTPSPNSPRRPNYSSRWSQICSCPNVLDQPRDQLGQISGGTSPTTCSLSLCHTFTNDLVCLFLPFYLSGPLVHTTSTVPRKRLKITGINRPILPQDLLPISLCSRSYGWFAPEVFLRREAICINFGGWKHHVRNLLR